MDHTKRGGESMKTNQRKLVRWLALGALVVALAAVLINCAAPPTPTVVPTKPPEPTATQRPAPTATQPPPTAAPASPTTATGAINMPLASSRTCANCHREIYDEWQQSYHSKTITAMMAGFKKYIGYVREKKGKVAVPDLMGCLGCHAPAMRFAKEEEIMALAKAVEDGKTDAVANVNVDCVTCHTLAASGDLSKHPGDKLVVSGPIKDPVEAKLPTGQVAHESKYAEITAKAELCQTCHTYVTPKDMKVDGGDWDIVCSLTYDAWKVASTGKEAGKQCQDCHMPTREGQAAQMQGATIPKRTLGAHTFNGWHSKSMLERNFDLALSAKPEGSNLVLTVAVTNKSGHRTPDT
jgi:hypothetical protein